MALLRSHYEGGRCAKPSRGWSGSAALMRVVIDRHDQVGAVDIPYPDRPRVSVPDWIVDLASGAVPTWWLSSTIDVSFCVSALEGALARRPKSSFHHGGPPGEATRGGVRLWLDGRGPPMSPSTRYLERHTA